MHITKTIAIVSVAAVLIGTSAQAQSIKKSTLSGTLTSAGAVATAAGTPVTIFTTPASGFFILTQACSTTPGVSNVTFTAGTVGTIVTSTSDECTQFINGIAIPVSTAIQCASGTGSNENCMITGVLSTK